MKKLLFLGAEIASAALFAEVVEVVEYVPACDWATFAPKADSTVLIPAANSLTDVYTLSADASLSVGLRMSSGWTSVFDFRSGDHTLSGKSLVFSGSDTSLYVYGGTWDLGGSAMYHGGSYYDANAKGEKLLLDGATLRNINYCYLDGACDGFLWMTNGASVSALNNLEIACNAGNFADISSGSVINQGNQLTKIACGAGKGGNVVQFRNASIIRMPGTYAHTYFCGGSPSNRVVFTDGASAYATYADFFKGEKAEYGENAKYNEIRLDHSAFTNTYGITIADAVGADNNRVVLNESELRLGEFGQIEFGAKGCGNTMILSNSVIRQMFYLRTGLEAGACGNKVRFVGQKCAWSIPTCYQKCFGSGTDNEFVLDDCTIDSYSAWLRFCVGEGDQDNNKSGGYSSASTNNVIRLVNGTYFRPYQIFSDYASKGNLFEVGAGCTLAALDIWFRGVENTLVVSNATVVMTQSGNGLTLGSAGDVPAGQPYVEDGNQLIVKGSHPKFRRAVANEPGNIRLYDNARLVIEIPETGYDADHVVFDGVGATINYPSTIRFRGVKEYAETLEKSVDIRFSNQSFVLQGVTQQDFLAEVNADLPKGCYAYFSSNNLWLHVKRAPRGMAIIVR